MRKWPVLITVIGLTITMLLIGFAHKGNDRSICNNVVISIDNQLNNHFIDDNDIMEMITNGYTEAIEGAAYTDINVRALEKRVLANDYVQEAEVFRDLKGNLLVNVLLRRPIARIVQYDGPDAYIAEDGAILPVSDKFSARVLLISGAASKEIVSLDNINDTDYASLFALVNHVSHDIFWKAQIAQILMQDNGEIKLLPQITKQQIEFGNLNHIENKFSRLKIFYKEILPRKGWNVYSRVSVKYKNQIICE
jgi:cell division protein FtsQ